MGWGGVGWAGLGWGGVGWGGVGWVGWGPCCRPATEAFDDGSAGPLAAPSQRRFFALLVAAGRQAYFPESQVYLELLADHGCAAAYPYDGGFVLRPARESFVASRPGMTVRAPFEQAAHGRMMMYTEDELSALLLAPTGLDCVQKIELTKLKWAYPGDAHGDDIGDTWAIIGLDASVEKVVMVAEGVAVPVGPAPGGAPPTPMTTLTFWQTWRSRLAMRGRDSV